MCVYGGAAVNVLLALLYCVYAVSIDVKNNKLLKSRRDVVR